MKKYTKEDLASIIKAHGKWWRGEAGGTRADLTGADLTSANLSSANLSSADLTGAAHAWAQVAFKGHGECGRMLTALIYKDGDAPVYQCGCFSGSLGELKAYIKGGKDEWKKSRTLAMVTVTKLLAI